MQEFLVALNAGFTSIIEKGLGVAQAFLTPKRDHFETQMKNTETKPSRLNVMAVCLENTRSETKILNLHP